MRDSTDASTRWGQVRILFDAVCDLPPDAQREALARLCDDPGVREEVLGLVDAQTEAFQTALRPLHDLAAKDDDDALAPGDRIGHWTLAARLGRGGMGSVFVAERDDGLFRQRVAVKILRRPADKEAAALLEAERAVLAGLVHPGIARLYDGGTTPNGRPFLVMEYVEGVPLDAWMRTHRPALAERMALFDQLCDAVGHAHRQLVVHCDLKPANVLVRADGRPMLLDFGIARWISADPDPTGGTGSGYCTPAYASPEQVEGRKPGVVSDVFSLGVILAELLADAPMGRTSADAATPTRSPSRFVAGAALAWRNALKGDLDAIVAKATALEPASRYPDVAALREDLARHAAHFPVAARPAGLARRSVLFLRRYRRGATAAALFAALGVGFTLQLVHERDRAREAAATAEQVSEFMVGAFDAANVRRDGGQRDLRARDVLASGAERITQDLEGQPRAQARLLLAIGRAYVSLGEPTEATPLLARAVELAEDDDGSLRVAIDALQHLSVVEGNAGHGREALAYAQRANALRERLGDDSPRAVAESLNHLGLALRAVRRFDEARDALQESLRLRRSLGAEAEGEVLSTLNNLALVERLADRPRPSEAIYREAVAMARRRGAIGEYSLQNALHGLGQALAAQRRFEEALPALREAHAIALRLGGEESQNTARALAELAMVLWDMGDLAAAEPMLRRGLETTQAASGPESMLAAIGMNNLGLLLEERGDAESARPLVEGSLAIRRRHLEPDDPALRRVAFNLARIELARGRIAEARTLTATELRDLLEHPDPQRREWWGQVLLGLEIAWRSGEPPARILETLSVHALPADDPALGAMRWRLPLLQATLLADDGRHAAAGATMERALSAVQANGNRLDVAKAKLVAAEIAARGGDAVTARRLLAEARPTLDDTLVDKAPHRRRAASLQRTLSP